MKKSLNYSSITIVLLGIALVIMSIGYANFERDLNINGTANVGSSKWSIKFLDSTYDETDGSVAADEESFNIAESTLTYSVELTKPGDFYEFTIDVKNEGTFDANLTAITLPTLTEAQAKYLTHELYYNGTKYTSSQSNIEDISLVSGASATVKVRVQYIQPANASDLPAAAQTITLNATLSYTQDA